MSGVVQHYNPNILKECRQQISIPTEEVQKKVPKILEMEAGEKNPTFKQLETLAELYSVPRWVFIRSELPEQFKFEKTVPGFRQIKDSPIAVDPYTNSHVKRIMTRVESLRSFILDLDIDMDQNIGDFNPPLIDENNDKSTAVEIRKWLGCNLDDCFSFYEWKELIEGKGIFVFLTSKYKGWSHVDRAVFRGLSIYHEKLPIIVINDSDAQKAQTFTLFHELAHLLRKESSTDSWYSETAIEQWCDRLAGSVLMPIELMTDAVFDLGSLKKLAKKTRVSPFACLVRQKQLEIIDSQLYKNLEAQLREEWELIRKKLKESDGGPARNIPGEVFRQYGKYSRTILQAYSENEINMHNVMRVFGLKKAGYVSDLMDIAQ